MVDETVPGARYQTTLSEHRAKYGLPPNQEEPDAPYQFKEKPPAKSSTSVVTYFPPLPEERRRGKIIRDKDLGKDKP